MGPAINALPEAFSIVKRNPILLVGAIIFAIIFSIGTVLSLIPVLGVVIVQVVIFPIAFIGFAEMANQAVTDDASLGDFATGIVSNGKNGIGAYGLMFCIQIGVGIVVAVAFAGIIGTAVLGIADAPSSSALSSIGAAAVVAVLLILAVIFLLTVLQQFLDVAVVVGDKDATDAIREAKDILVERPLSVVGYSLLRFSLFFGAIIVPAALAAGVGSLGNDAVGGSLMMIVSGLVLVIGPPIVAFIGAYHVAYYRDRRSDELGPSGNQPREQSTTATGDPMR